MSLTVNSDELWHAARVARDGALEIHADAADCRSLRERCAQIIEHLTPNKQEYDLYLGSARDYDGLMRSAIRLGRARVETRGFGWRKSRLFNSRRYLVAFVDDAWAQEVAPDCDAFVSPGVERSGTFLVTVPPLVMIPESRKRLRNRAFRSVIEHEIVHVNQAIRGVYPLGPGPGVQGLLDEYQGRVRMEYQANLLQLAHWPDHYPQDSDLSLEHWCVLRGHTDGLERCLGLPERWRTAPGDVLTFVESLPQHLVVVFAKLGIDDFAEWFVARLGSYVRAAAGLVARWRPELAAIGPFREFLKALHSDATPDPAAIARRLRRAGVR